MKNMIMYYYDFKELVSFRREGKYFFRSGENVFSLERITNRAEILDVAQLLSYYGDARYYKIKKNIYNSFVTTIQGYEYILVQYRIFSFNLAEELIKNVKSVPDKIPINYSNWIELWSQKLDYYEYQVQHILGVYPIIDESIYYFLGMGETAIAYLKYNFSFQRKPLYISHRRINSQSYFHPLNVIVDYKARDVSEYFKHLFYSNQYLGFDFFNFFQQFQFDYDDYILIFSRLLFPSFYFDQYDEVVNTKGGEDAFKEFVKKIVPYEEFLRNIHLVICRFIEIPKVDWL